MAAKMINKILIILFVFAMILPAISAQCQENWYCNAWNKCFEGTTERACYDLGGCNTAYEKPNETSDCRTALPLCYDKKINQDESDTDCGGKICEKCGLGRFCFRNDDCQEGTCISNACAFEEAKTEEQAPAPAPMSFQETLALILPIIILFIIILAMKKLKRGKTIIIHKEEKQVSSKKRQVVKIKKSRLNRFVENFKDYLSSIKPDKKPAIKEEKSEKKDLLNKNSCNKQAAPIRSWMLNNIKEAYNND